MSIDLGIVPVSVIVADIKFDALSRCCSITEVAIKNCDASQIEAPTRVTAKN